MTDDTPMECHALDQSRDEKVQAMIIRNRRLMRREYSRNYGHDSAHPLPEPILEQSGFAPVDPDAEQKEFLSKRDAVRDSYFHGFTHGAIIALALVVGITAVLLWSYK